MQTLELPALNERLIDVAKRAESTGRILIQHESDVLIAPTILPGWHRLGIAIRQPREKTCAA
jgi:hypothetical protein